MFSAIQNVASATANYVRTLYSANLERTELENKMRDGLRRAAEAYLFENEVEILRSVVPEAQYASAENPVLPDDQLSAEVYLALAKAYLSLGNKTKVVETCRKGLQCEHNGAEIKANLHLHLTNGLRDFHQYAEAALVADEGRKLRPQISQPLYAALELAYTFASGHPQEIPVRPEQTRNNRLLDPVRSQVFPRNNMGIPATMRLLQATHCFDNRQSRIYRDLEGRGGVVKQITKAAMVKCHDLVKAGLDWSELHRNPELTVDLYAMLHLAIHHLVTVHQQPRNSENAIAAGLRFCESSYSPGMLKARFYLKLSGHQIREQNYDMAFNFC